MAPHAGTTFRADVHITRFQDIVISTGRSSQVQYYTDNVHLQNAQDTIAILSVLSGKVHGKQHGKDAIVGPGEGFAILNSEQASVNAVEDGCYRAIYVPRSVISLMVPDLERMLMQPAALNSAAFKLLVNYAGFLQETGTRLDPVLKHSIANHICDLVACALGGGGEENEETSARGLRAARLRAIKEDILAHLTDHDLSAETVAQRQDVTSRYIRKLLDSEGTTFSDLVLRLRLMRAHRLLCDPRHMGTSVSTIAYRVGFGDLSYFNRTFRRQFGMTPSEARLAVTQP